MTERSPWFAELARRVSVVSSDITQQDVDAIVNAANASLLGGGGVDGAIHKAAGPQLLAECKTIGGCPTGEARLTQGYRLKARHVIHTVGPVWRDGSRYEPELLRRCYKSCLTLAEQHSFASVAFPAISTGAFGFPPDLAAAVATQTVVAWLQIRAFPASVVFVCFGEPATQTLRVALEATLARAAASMPSTPR
jgi:O-acetyl-ADP-ribose deacetylase (regulator of RNase III)